MNSTLEKNAVYFAAVKPGEIAYKGSKSLISAFAYSDKDATDGEILFIYLYNLRETPEGELDIENYGTKLVDIEQVKYHDLSIENYLFWNDSYDYELIK